MASYLPQIADYIPQIQPFRPDYNFYAGALQMKQSQYDSAHKQLSNLYGSLLNTPMLRDNNIQARDQYFKTIDQEIKKISNLDLSLQQNVDQATRLFSGLYENQNIVKDMVWTKNYQKELSRADGYRNCIDPAKCGGAYWEEGVRALHYRADEFRNASDDQAMGMSNVRFTPYQNVMERAIKYSKDAGLNITVDQIQGGYIVTTKNGPNLIQPLNALFTGLFASDPAIMEYYNTKAYVQRKDWVSANTPVYGSAQAAEAAYVNEMSAGLRQMLGQAQEDVDTKVDNINAQKKRLEEKIRTEGAHPNGTLAEQYRALNNVSNQAISSQDSITNANRSYQGAMDPNMQAYVAENIDRAMASFLLSGDIGMAAQTLAYKDYEYRLKEDPYAMESVRQANRLQLEEVKFKYRMLEKDFEKKQAEAQEQQLRTGDGSSNLPIAVPSPWGTSDIESGKDAVMNQFLAITKGQHGDLSASEKQILRQLVTLTRDQSKGVEKGAGIATDDLLKFGELLLTGLSDQESLLYNDQTGQYYSSNSAQLYQDALRKWKNEDGNGWSKDQKLKFLYSQDMDKWVNSLSGTVLDDFYNQTGTHVLDMTNGGNQVNREYLMPMWNSPENAMARTNIQTKNDALEMMDGWYTEQMEKVVSGIRVKNGDLYADTVEMMYNTKNGAKRTMNDFVNDYSKYLINKGVHQTEARATAIGLYEGEIEIGSFAYKGTALDYESWTGQFANERGKTIDQFWAEAFSLHSTPNEALNQLGLSGAGSYSTQALSFPYMDSAEYLSGATTNTISFLKDVISAVPENVRAQLGIPQSTIPEESTEGLNTFLNQFFIDLVNRKDFDDKKRPTGSVLYSRIAGGDTGWSVLNIKPSYGYVEQYIGTENNPGPLYAHKDNLENGISIYLNDENSTNGFYQATNTSDLEAAIAFSEKYKFDSYPQYTKDLQIKKNDAGFFVLSGQVQKGYKEDGSPNWISVYNEYPKLGSDPNLIVGSINTSLQSIALANEQWDMTYGSQYKVYDPAALLTE